MKEQNEQQNQSDKHVVQFREEESSGEQTNDSPRGKAAEAVTEEESFCVNEQTNDSPRGKTAESVTEEESFCVNESPEIGGMYERESKASSSEVDTMGPQQATVAGIENLRNQNKPENSKRALFVHNEETEKDSVAAVSIKQVQKEKGEPRDSLLKHGNDSIQPKSTEHNLGIGGHKPSVRSPEEAIFSSRATKD